MGSEVDWRGGRVLEICGVAAKSALTELGGRWEAAAKGSLRPGRGVVTGTYRRSLHYANPGYNFSSDDTRPANGSPERAGAGGGAERIGLSVRMTVGSGMRYAIRLEQLYAVVTTAVDQVKGRLPEILARKTREGGLS